MKWIGMTCLFFLTSCYSFKGISIDPTVNYFYVETFEDVSGRIPPGYNEIFSEALTQKVLSDTRLDLSDDQAEIFFTGKFTRFDVQSEDPTQGTQTNLNRLYVTISVTYQNDKTEEEWTNPYDDVIDFDANVSFDAVEEELLNTIQERIIERIFLDAFTNW